MNQAHIVKTLKIMSVSQGLTMLADLGRRHTPFQILIAAILSARAKDEITLPISARLFQKYGTPGKLAEADPKVIKNLIRRIGFYNNKTKAIIAASKKIHKEHGGDVPQDIEGLLALPGVGRKVANCILVYAFHQKAIPVDTHVHRICNRLGWIHTKAPHETERALEGKVPRRYWTLINESLVKWGKTVCVPISPFCSRCAVEKYCLKVGVVRSR